MDSPKLSYSFLKESNHLVSAKVQVPEENHSSLPEKVLQFGVGVQLRSLPDFFIHKANEKGIFNGRIVAVSLDEKEVEHFKDQNCLFTHNIRGTRSGRNVNDFLINSSISRVLNAKREWSEVLKCAHNPDLSVVLFDQNSFAESSDITNQTISNQLLFPARLVSFLFERFKAFNASRESGLVIIAIVDFEDNGKPLKDMVIDFVRKNYKEKEFLSWVESLNSFCNSFCDRLCINSDENLRTNYDTLGFRDELMIVTESYRQWVIQGENKVKERLPFLKSDKGIIFDKNIDKHKEKVVRILRGAQTISAGLGFLLGLHNLPQCIENPLMGEFIRNLMNDEIIPAVDMERKEAEEYGKKALERLGDASISLPLTEIIVKYSEKIREENINTIVNFYKKFIEVPRYFALGFAGYLSYMRVEKKEGEKHYGRREDELYSIADPLASYFFDQWKRADTSTINSCKLFVEEIIDEEMFWGSELKTIPGFSDAVAHSLFELIHKGVKETLEELVEFGEIEE